MKRLLTYLGLLATLLAMPYHAKAEKWAYYLYGEINAWKKSDAKTNAYFFGETYNGSASDQPSWTKTFKGSQLDPDGNGEALFKILLDKDGTTTNLGPNGSDDKKLEVNGSAETLYKDAGKAYKVTGIKPKAEYTIKYVSTTRYGGTISITGPATENTNIKLKGNYSNPEWGVSTKYDFFADGIYTWVFDKSVFKSGTQFKLFEDLDGDSNDKWYSTGLEITEDWSSELSDDKGKANMKVLYSDNDIIKISVQAMKTSSGWKMRIVKAYEPHDYYWVSPQVTNNQRWPYFKLVPSRNRSRDGGDGQISSKYYTFTIQDEFIKQFNGSDMSDNTQIQWYIVRDDGKVFYRPESELPVDYTPNSHGTLDSHVSYKNYWGSEGYMTTDADRSGSFSFSKGSAKAYTFILNAENGNVFFNYTTASGDTNIDYYLIGNFTSAKGEVDISIDDTHPMTKWYYRGNEVSQSPLANADSIVYKVNVEKPTEGWGDLYIDINPSGNTDWNNVIRPLISLGNNLDGRALHGGLVVNNSNQSLNPETSDDYLGYTFSFNATTFTYRLEFHTSLYLVGPGVSATEGSGSWDISTPSTSDPRIRLTATQEKDHYRNLVYFTNGGQFRFIKNTDESTNPNYAYTWMENNNAPKFSTATTDSQYTPGNETQYKNNLEIQDGTGSSSNTAPSGTSVTFDLPTGWYYVNFYPNAATPYYTIEHSMELRDFKDVYYGTKETGEVRNVKGRNDYNFLRVWSDHIAWNKPDNIDVFVVSAFDHNATTHTTTATLTKLDVNYIPAKTGVILGCKLSKDNLTSGLVYDNAATLAYDKGENVNYYNTLTAELTPYSTPSTSYDGTSKLIPLYEETSLQRFSDETGIGTGDGYANYLFGFYRCKKYQKNYTGNDYDFQMGFWLTTGIGTTYANSAFLHLTKAQAEDLGVGTAYDTSASAASAPAFMLLFDESDDNVITGISDITTAKGNSVASQGWYTLQGVRTPKPTQRGIYIYNGKKVIVND